MLDQATPAYSPAPALQEELYHLPRGDARGVSLIEILIQLARSKVLIAQITGASLLLGVALAFLLPVRYTAITRIMTPQQTQSTAAMMMSQLAGSGAGSLAAAAAGGGALGLKNPNDLYQGLLKSRTVADAMIKQFQLMDVYRARDLTEAREKMAKYSSIESEKSGLIAISVTDRDKDRAAAMANAYTAQLRVLTKSLATTEASQRRLFYEEQLKQAKEALDAAALHFQQVQQAKGLVQLDAQAKTMITSLAALRAQAAAKEVELEALRTYSTEQNPEVELARSQLATLQGEAAQLEQQSHSSGFGELGLKDVPGAGSDYIRAEHELLYRQTLFDLLIKQYDAARLDEAKDAAIIQVVEPAIAPDRRSTPKRALVVALTTLGGFCIACLTALVLWWSRLLAYDPEAQRKIGELLSAFAGKSGVRA